MNKEEYYTRMVKIQNRLSTDRCSIDEEHNLIAQKCYLKDKYIETCEQQIGQLTNNWNELEEWLKELQKLYEGNEFQNNAKFCITVDQALDKMKEIKEGNNVSSRD